MSTNKIIEALQESNNFKSRLEKIENLANEEVEEGSNFKSRLEKLNKIANESKVIEDDVPDKKQYSVDEDKWVTMKGTHVLLNNKGKIKNKKMRDKIESHAKNKVKKNFEKSLEEPLDVNDPDYGKKMSREVDSIVYDRLPESLGISPNGTKFKSKAEKIYRGIYNYKKEYEKLQKHFEKTGRNYLDPNEFPEDEDASDSFRYAHNKYLDTFIDTGLYKDPYEAEKTANKILKKLGMEP